MLEPVAHEDPMEELTPEDVAEFKALLTRQLDELLDTAERTVGYLLETGLQSADPIDRAALDTDRNYTLRIRDRESHLIKKIKKTLIKIEDGTFGVCEECEGPISLPRLKARLVTAYCIDCKTKLEAIEKASGF